MKKILFALLLIIITGAAAGAENFCGINEKMLSPAFWTRARGIKKEILLPKQAFTLSQNIKATPKTYCVDITAYPELISKGKVMEELANFSKRPKSERFLGPSPASDAFWQSLEAQTNTGAVRETTVVRFAVAVQNAALKTLPTDEPLYSEPNDLLFDMNVESTLKIWEPLAILHASADGKWYFTVSPSASGWLHAEAAAFTDKKTITETASRDFYTVTGNRVTTDLRTEAANEGRREFFMGTKLPKADDVETAGGVASDFSYLVLVPERAPDGSLRVATERIPRAADVTAGYLPCTEENIVKQAFKMLGERYGWGGMFSARDCSAFTRDIYACFGIELPRNSGAQTKIPSARWDAAKMTADEKKKLLTKCHAGTLLQMPGHIMLYLGTVNNKPYIIHDVYALGPSGRAGADGRRTINCVAVTDMEMTRKDGTSVIDNITNIVTMMPEKSGK